MNFYKRYPGDYAKKTSRLTLAQHGAYSLLLDEIYLTEAPLPADLDELHRICRAMTKPEQEAVRIVADRFFPVAADGLRHNERATEEIAAAAPAIEAARLNGKKGGRPTKKGQPVPPDNPPNNPLGFESETQVEPSSKALHSPDRDLSTDVDSSLHARNGYSPEFEQAWREYPSRTGHSKAEAHRAWKARLADGVTVSELLEGVKRYAAYCQACRTEPRFVKHAATFFGPDQHYRSDWTPPAAGRALAANSSPYVPSIHERRANTMAGLTSTGEAPDDRTFDAEARIVG
ncbi:YdaU family protein [Pseudacidovorax intermedius]|uniref:YdaU family protein n=1 Tax=Pseudacidovorax intermedius TaxID=433924 RepID=UPI00069D853F|nr:YdaU family protein [Pseudacidovorax intermedius]